MEKQKTILVTGGAGFIGSHLCEYLLNQGNKVICLDNFYSGSKDNIKHLLQNPNFKLMVHDVMKPFFLEVDQIYHLACPASPISYQFDPIYTLKTNILGAINVLELARVRKARILFTSTSEVYGDPLEHPQKETYFGNVNPISVRACYDEGKRASETLFMDYHRQFSMDVKIVRVFNAYGPKMALNDGRAISNFIVKALNNDDILIYGDGINTRSPQYITDLIDGLVRMMEKDDFIGPVNLGNPEEITINELAEKVKKMCLSNSKIIHIKEQEGDPKKRYPDISLAKEKLGWKPAISLENGLKETINYFIERLKIKTNILIFSTAYDKLSGPAEKVIEKLVADLPNFQFHVVASRLDRKMAKLEQEKNLTVHRIGTGSAFDKYLLSFLGPIKARSLHKKEKFSLVWLIMPSYGLIPALIFRILHKVPFVSLFYKGEVKSNNVLKNAIIQPLYKWAFKKSEIIKTLDQETINKLKEVGKNFELDFFWAESGLDAHSIKEVSDKVINKISKRLYLPK